MFNLACKGLHCAGCGKGIPASVILVLGATYVATMFPEAVAMAIVAGSIIIGVCWVIAVSLLALFVRKGPPVVFVRKGMEVTFSQQKFLETGDPEWLALMGDIPLPEAYNVVTAEIIPLDDPS